MDQQDAGRQTEQAELHSDPSHGRPGKDDPGTGETVLQFGNCRLWPRTRRLLVDGSPIEIGSRAFDLLTVLIEARGILLSKSEIMDRLWPDTIVDECNLRAQMSALRKALGDERDAIKTIPGRGYVFVGEVTTAPAEPVRTQAAPAFPRELPVSPAAPANHWPTQFQDACAADEMHPTVVVIDDDPAIREALHGLLRSVGLRAELFATVREFLAAPRPDLPGCLVLDVRLPGRSGLEFQDDLARANIHLPVIFISGYADVPMSVRAMKAGAVEFLTKPVRHQELLDAIQLAIARDHARRRH